MKQLVCIPTQITKNDNTFVVLKAITGKCPAKPFLSMKQVTQKGLPLNVPIKLLWEYATINNDVLIVDPVAFQIVENWDFDNTMVETIPEPGLISELF